MPDDMALRPGLPSLDYISVCAGGGGLDLALELAVPGARPCLLVEREAFAVARLVEAMRQGFLAPAPVWSDARTVPGRRFRGCVDGVIGGIPCQPHSLAGKRLAHEDERDLWSPFRRLLVQSGAWFCWIENVGGMLSSGGAERVHRDLQRLGFAVEGGLFRAAEVGAPHERERLFILGVADGCRDRQLRRQKRHFGPVGPGEQPPRRDHAHGRDLDVGRTGAGVGLADACRPRLQGRGPDGDRPGQRATAERGGGHLGDAHGPRADIHASQGGPRGAAGEPSRALVHTLGGGRDGRPDLAQRGPQGRAAAELDGGLCGAERVAHADQPQPPPQRGHAGEVRGLPEGQGGAEHGPDLSGGGRPGLFPPGPADRDAWSAIAANRPDLLPAIAQPRLRGVDDGLAPRVDQLRLLGNGVVPLQGGYAFRSLATDLARRSSGAAELVRMMGEHAHP